MEFTNRLQTGYVFRSERLHWCRINKGCAHCLHVIRHQDMSISNRNVSVQHEAHFTSIWYSVLFDSIFVPKGELQLGTWQQNVQKI